MTTSAEEHAATASDPGRFRVRQFFLLFVPVVLLVLGGAWYVGQARIDVELGLVHAHEKLNVVVSASRLNSHLQTPVRHVRAITEEAQVRQAIEVGGAEAEVVMAADFSTLISRNPDYDQVRWLDETGMERVRVDNVAGRPAVIAAPALQNKRDRDYFRAGMGMAQGEVYLSPLDLNVEHGRIEQPYRPMLRTVTPVFDGQGQRRGVLVINVGARTLLNDFAADADASQAHLMLLNREGYWLKSPTPADEWGFMFRRKDTLGSRYPHVWAQIAQAEADQKEHADGLWSWQAIRPLGIGAGGVSEQPYLLVVSHLPAAMLAPIRINTWAQVGGFSVLLLLVSGLLVGRLVQVQGRHRQAEVESVAAQARTEALHKQMEAQQRFRHVVEASTNGILVADHTGNIVLANPALADMFGYAVQDVLHQPVEMLMPAQIHGQHMQHRAEYARHPSNRSMGGGRELLGQRRNGEQFPVEVGLSTYTSEGEAYVLATVVDISERNQLREKSLRLVSIVNSTEDAIISKTLDGIITSWNPGAEKLFGYRADEAIGQPITLLLPAGREPEERELLARIARGETIEHYDTVRRHKDGHLFDVSSTISPLRDAQGRIVGASKIARDVSALKRAQRRIQDLNASLQQRVRDLAVANQELDSFAYAVSHDLRAPLRAMSGFSHALLEDYGDRLDATARTYLEEIGNASQRMGELIDGILALSRSTRGELQYVAIDLSAMATCIRDELARPEPERVVQWQIAAGLTTWGDPRLIENVLRNLMGNAWKYSSSIAQPVISVYAEESDGERWFCVADNGAGFDMQHAAKLGQPFQRLHRQDEFPGLGIGLATVQRIINRHHGKFRAQAEPGRGATFAFTLPEQAQQQEEAA